MGKTHSSRILHRLSLLVLAAGVLGPSTPGLARSAAPSAPAVSLIYAGWFGNTIPTPAFIRDHQAFLDSQPFQGMVAYLRDDATGQNATTGIMGQGMVSPSTLAGILAPLQGLSFTNLVDNFALVQGSTPPDFFDDWSQVVANFGALAAALQTAGLRGICFDNEQYASPWGTYPAGAKYPSTSLADYQTQARLRGAECMQAMVAQFPGIAVITLHGPYISELQAPAALGFPQWQSGNLLLGPFFAGFLQGAGTAGRCVDGGELYSLRTDSDFQNSATWRKVTLPSAAINCPFIPTDLRAVWPDRVSISFGVYDQPFAGAPMNASILETTLANALHHADRYVWFYTEGATFLLPPSSGGAGADWVTAVQNAVASAPSLPVPAAPTGLVAVPTSSSSISLGWTNAGSGTTAVEIERKTGPDGSYQTVAQLGAGTQAFQDGSLAPGTTYVYRVRATAAGGTPSPYSNESTATTDPAAAPTTPASPATDPSSSPQASTGSGTSGGSCGLLGLEGLLLILPLFAGLRRLRSASEDR